MKVLADHHHDDLYESLRILFEDRLGWELYRPIGTEWYTEGFWDVYNHPDTVTQYLGLQIGKEFQEKEVAEHMPWMNRDNDGGNDGIYVVPGRGHNKAHRAITLEKFKKSHFDIVVSSMPSHFGRYETLVAKYQPHAKHIFQMGNMWSVPSGVKNLLNSTTVNVGGHINHVRYHQEFDLKVFHPQAITNPKVVVNMQHYIHDRPTFRNLESALPGWSFKEHGAGNRDGPVEIDYLPDTIKQSGFMYHVKHGGEGYGYNIHHAYACGKPMLTRTSCFRGMTAAAMFVDGVTCIDMDNKSLMQIAQKLENAAADYQAWSDRAFAHFKTVVDFDQEFEDIKAFLERLQ